MWMQTARAAGPRAAYGRVQVLGICSHGPPAFAVDALGCSGGSGTQGCSIASLSWAWGSGGEHQEAHESVVMPWDSCLGTKRAGSAHYLILYCHESQPCWVPALPCLDVPYVPVSSTSTPTFCSNDFVLGMYLQLGCGLLEAHGCMSMNPLFSAHIVMLGIEWVSSHCFLHA